MRPRLVDTDWILLRGLRTHVARLAQGIARPSAVALDFGCGARPYERLFQSLGVRYLGADFDATSQVAIGADGRLEAQSASADIVLSFQVLEHVADLERYFSEAARVIRPDGWMLLSTHGTWLYHPHPEDHRRWTRQGLQAEITAHGFEVVETASIVGPLAWTTMLRLTCFCYALRKLPVVGRFLAAALAVPMNLRAYVEDAVTPAWVTRDNACVYLMSCRPRPC